MGFSVFFMPADDVAGRTGMLVTLILTLVALKFSMTSLPAVPYLTFMDKQLIVGFLLLSCMMIAVCVSSRHAMQSTEVPWTVVDQVAAAAVAALWLPPHAFACFVDIRRPWSTIIKQRGSTNTGYGVGAIDLQACDILERQRAD